MKINKIQISQDRAKTLIVITLLLLISIFYASINRRIISGDSVGYYHCGLSLLNGTIFPRDTHYFGYPLLICISLFFFGKTLFALHFFPYILTVFSPILMFFVSKQIFQQTRYSFFCSLLLIFFPFQFFVVNKAMTEPIFIFFFILIIYLMQNIEKHAWYSFAVLFFSSWLILIRYDSILILGFVLIYLFILAYKKRKPLTKWILLGIILFIFLQVPLAFLNHERNISDKEKHKLLLKNKLIKDEKTLKQIKKFEKNLPREIEDWEKKGLITENLINVSLINKMYDNYVPTPNKPHVIKSLEKIQNKTKKNRKALRKVTFLPSSKIKGWLNTRSFNRTFMAKIKKTVSWIKALLDEMRKLYSISEFILAFIIISFLILFLLRGSWFFLRKGNTLLRILVLFYISYSLLELFYIRGSVIRHMSRIIPLTLIFITQGIYLFMQKIHNPKKLKQIEAFSFALLITGSISISMFHKENRSDICYMSIGKLLQTPIKLDDKLETWDENNDKYLIQQQIFENLYGKNALLNKRDKEILSNADFYYLVNFCDETYKKYCLEKKPSQAVIWKPEFPGRIGIKNGMLSVELVLAFEFNRNIKDIILSTWYLMRFPLRNNSDDLSIYISDDEGTKWKKLELEKKKERLVNLTTNLS
ncbi:MAG: glycosyltransferase family 39 protein, partial [Candidatus Theseobacter exili]|nr:glycosyltransferase family 39 protein [Candidatus Theseobacter exili]